jgi:hypothetical protein
MMTPQQRSTLEKRFTAKTSPFSRILSKTQSLKPLSSEPFEPLDVSKHSILSLKNWARTSLRDSRNSALSQKDRYNAEIYWDGYMRAIEHILDMEEQ